MSSDLAIRVDGLAKSYTIRHQQSDHVTLAQVALDRAAHPFRRQERESFWALKDVSFEVRQGEVLGVIGRNGAGKSTLLKLVTRITVPTAGRVELWGRVGSLLEVGTGFHPELTGRENVYLNGSILGMSRREIDRQFDAIVDFAGVERFLDTPVKRYSSGMYVRLAFAIAAHLETEILLVDEVLAVGDQDFQQKCAGKMRDVATEGRTILFVSHNMSLVSQLTDRALYLDGGRLAALGPTDEVLQSYRATGGARAATDGEYLITDADRWNPGGLGREVEIVSLRLLDGRPRLEPQSDLRVQVRLKAHESVPAFRAHVGVLTVDGLGVCAAFSDESIGLEAGHSKDVVLRMPNPQLAPGAYQLEISVGHGDHFGSLEHFDVVTRVAHFDVGAPTRDDGTVALGWAAGWGAVLIPKLFVESQAASVSQSGDLTGAGT
jgi:lipopolysaccharide transport system ATP-binding protein